MAIAKYRKDACALCGSPQSVVDGAWLRQQRLRAGYTLREFATVLQLSAAYVSDIERNRRNCLPPVRAAYEAL